MHVAFNPPGISCLAEPEVGRNVKIHTWKSQDHWNNKAKPRARAWSQAFNMSFSHFTVSAESAVTLKRNHFSFKIHYILIADLLTSWRLCIDFCKMLWKVGTGIEHLVELTAFHTKWQGCCNMQTLEKEMSVIEHLPVVEVKYISENRRKWI